MTDTDMYDFVVVGGGLVGAAIAWGLAGIGQRVVVLDEGDQAYRAARGNFALVWVQGKGVGLSRYADWSRTSAEKWTGFAATLLQETGIDVAYERPGGFQLCLSEAELAARVEGLERLHAQADMIPYPWEVLDRAAVASRLPGVGPDVVGATYSPLDGHCNALRLFRAIHLGAQARGATYSPSQRVEEIVSGQDGFRLKTATTTFRTRRLVLAAGLGNRRLAPMVGLEAPVRPQRGQIIATERTEPLLHYPMSQLRQTDEGSFLVGDSLEEAGFDDTVGLGILSTMADRAVRMFPALGALNVVRTWAALRVMSPDGFPVYEQSQSHPGAFLATCHSGVTLAANHALTLAPAIAAGGLSADLEAFSARRFHVPAAA
jgi:glycine/D-amino acid oxidase-like deaminating enzyme